MEQSNLKKDNLKSIFHDSDYYIKIFRIFAKASAKFDVLAKWGENIFSEQVVGRLNVNIPDGDEFRALGIGVGSGEIDSIMMLKLDKRYSRITNVVVEPAYGQIKLYKDLINTKVDQLKHITYNWHIEGLDEFRETQVKSGNVTKFHFISAIHSLYHMDDLEDTLRWLYDHLENGGILLIMIVSDNSGTGRLWHRYKIFEEKLLRFCNSAHIRDTLSKLNVPFVNYKQKSRVDVTDSFVEGNTDGQAKIDFLTRVMYFHKTVSPEFRKELMDFVGGPSCSEREDGEILFNNDWDAIIVTK